MNKDELIAKQQIEIENLKAALSNGNLQKKEGFVIYTRKWNWWALEYKYYRDGELIPNVPLC